MPPTFSTVQTPEFRAEARAFLLKHGYQKGDHALWFANGNREFRDFVFEAVEEPTDVSRGRGDYQMRMWRHYYGCQAMWFPVADLVPLTPEARDFIAPYLKAARAYKRRTGQKAA